MKWFKRRQKYVPPPWMLNPEARERWDGDLYAASISGVSTAELGEMMRRGPLWWCAKCQPGINADPSLWRPTD